MPRRAANRSASTGRFVATATARRHPRTTTTESLGGGGHSPLNRSAITGRFVSDATVRRHPGTTTRETR